MNLDDIMDSCNDLDVKSFDSQQTEMSRSGVPNEWSLAQGKPPRGPKDPPSGPPHTPPGHQPGHPGDPGKPDTPTAPPINPPGRREPPPHRIKPQPVFGEPSSAWWLESPEMWDREQRMMNDYYPGWQSADCYPNPEGLQTNACKAWIGDITPLQSPSNAVGVVNALAADMPILVYQNGRVDVDRACPTGSANKLGIDESALRRTFSLIARQAGPPRHPRVFVMIPELPRFCPHTFADEAVCPLLPSSGAWSWPSNSLADYLNHVSIWLVKFMVWDFTKKATGSGIWIGSEAPHDRATLARTPLWAQCYCGSGLRFGQCCRAKLSNHSEKRSERLHTQAATISKQIHRS